MITLSGEAGGPDTVAASRDRYGRLSARSYRELSLELPAEGIEVDADHDGQRLGELLYLELGDDERLRAVCVLDGDWLANVAQPVYFSPMLSMRGRGIDRDTYIAASAEMIGLSVTLETARVGAYPVSRRQGDLRDPVARRTWPFSWQRSDPLLARALNALGTDWQARTRSASRIVDRRDDGDYPWHLLPSQAWRQAGTRPAGAMRHGPRGRVISVR